MEANLSLDEVRMKTRGPGAPKKDPRLLKVPVGFKLPQWLVDKLKEYPAAQSYAIEQALQKTYGWEPPDTTR